MWEPREDTGQSPQGHLGILGPAEFLAEFCVPVGMVGRVGHLQLGFQAVSADAEDKKNTSTITKIYL